MEQLKFGSSLKINRSAKGYMHMKIVKQADDKYVLGVFSKPFKNIPEMIHHYSINKLPIRGAEHMSLLYPVIDQLLWEREEEEKNVTCYNSDSVHHFRFDTWCNEMKRRRRRNREHHLFWFINVKQHLLLSLSLPLFLSRLVTLDIIRNTTILVQFIDLYCQLHILSV